MTFSHALAALWPKVTYLTQTVIVLLAAFLYFSIASKSYAQSHAPTTISLQIGDTVPESFYTQIHYAVSMRSGEPTSLSMERFKDQLIVLDFWATWCKPCLASLQKLAGMPDLAENNILIIPITDQSLADLKGMSTRLPLPFVSIIGDTVLSKLFPHTGIPFMVWIKDGKVIDTPLPHWVDEHSLKHAAEGKHQTGSLTFTFFDMQRFIGTQQQDSTVLMRSVIRKGQPEKSQQSPLYETAGGKTYFYTGNVPLVNGLFRTAFENQISPHYPKRNKPPYSGVDLEISDNLRSKLEEPRPDYNAQLSSYENKLMEDSWIKRRYYSYEFFADTLLDKDEVLQIMQGDINAYFGNLYGISGKIEEVQKPVAILHTIHGKAYTIEKLRSKGGKKIYDKTEDKIKIDGSSYVSTTAAIRFMDVIPAEMPLLDSTGIAKNEIRIAIDLRKGDQGDIVAANKQLKTYDLKLEVTTMPAPILHIRETQVNTQNPKL